MNFYLGVPKYREYLFLLQLETLGASQAISRLTNTAVVSFSIILYLDRKALCLSWPSEDRHLLLCIIYYEKNPHISPQSHQHISLLQLGVAWSFAVNAVLIAFLYYIVQISHHSPCIKFSVSYYETSPIFC